MKRPHLIEAAEACQTKDNLIEDWEKQFDELSGLEMVGNARTYTKHLDPEAVKGFIMMVRAKAEAAGREEADWLGEDILDARESGKKTGRAEIMKWAEEEIKIREKVSKQEGRAEFKEEALNAIKFHSCGCYINIHALPPEQSTCYPDGVSDGIRRGRVEFARELLDKMPMPASPKGMAYKEKIISLLESELK